MLLISREMQASINLLIFSNWGVLISKLDIMDACGYTRGVVSVAARVAW